MHNVKFLVALRMRKYRGVLTQKKTLKVNKKTRNVNFFLSDLNFNVYDFR